MRKIAPENAPTENQEEDDASLISVFREFGLSITTMSKKERQLAMVIVEERTKRIEATRGKVEALLERNKAMSQLDAVKGELAKTESRAVEAESLAITDTLTGIGNRRHLFQELERQTKERDRKITEGKSYPISVLMLDLDRFKWINDTLGHPVGDEALKIVGNILRNSLRPSDFAGRYGGEELAVVLPETKEEDAILLANRLKKKISDQLKPYLEKELAKGEFLEEKVLAGTVSIGVFGSEAKMEPEALIHEADQAALQAKKEGRDRVIGRKQMMKDYTATKEALERESADAVPKTLKTG